MAGDLRFRILGPLEVVSTGGAVPIGAARHRAVLALLLLSPNRHVARDVLVDRIWSGDPPPAAVKTLQSYVSRLRGVLGGHLEAGPGGRAYRLAIGPDVLDAEVFADLVAAGRADLADGDHGAAARAFERALALWRGRLLADLADDYRFVDDAARRWEALRAEAVSGAFEAAAALGRLGGRVDELGEAVRRYPDRSGLRELQLRALYEAGRQEEAFTAYERYRQVRLDRGLDPEPAIERLYRRILQQDPALIPAPVPPGFVGRGAPLARLRTALTAATAGRGRCVLVRGEAGVGKTALVARLADEAVAAGALVVSGSPHDASGPAGFRAWVQVLAAIRTATGADAGLNEALGREEQFGTVAAVLRSAAADRTLLVLLDDIHDADAGSVKLLSHVVRQLHGVRALVVAVARDPVDSPGAADWPEAAERLRRLVGVETLHLGPLDAEEGAQLVAYELGGTAPQDLLAAVVSRAGGNPLFTIELTRLLADERTLARLRRTGRLPALPPVVRDAVRQRADRLPPACRQLLSLAAVLGPEVELSVLAADPSVAGEDFDRLLQLAVEQRFIEEPRPGVLQFRHPLVHEALYADLPPRLRERLHARAIAAIERAHAGRLDPYAERLAHHWGHLAGPEARAQAATHALRASRQAAALLAWEDAARLLRTAIELDDGDDPANTARLLLDLGDLLVLAGETIQAGQSFQEALALAPPDQQPELFIRGALAIAEAGIFLAARSYADHTVSLIERALALVQDADPALRARLLASLGAAMMWDSTAHTEMSRQRRAAHTDEALRLARQADSPMVLMRALAGRVGAIWRPDNPQERMDLCADLVALADANGERDLALEGRRGRFAAALELGRADVARADAAAGTAAAREVPLTHRLFWDSALHTTLALMTGDFAGAEQAIARTLEHSAGLEDRASGELHTGLTGQILMYHRETGRLPAAVAGDPAALRRSLAVHLRHNAQLDHTWRMASATFLVSTGQRAPAHELFASVTADLDGIPYGPQWMATIAIAAELCATFHDPDAALRLRELLAPHAGQHVVVTFGFATLGSVSHFLGQLATVLGDRKEADDYFQSAVEANRQLLAPPLVARTQLAHGRMLSDSARPAERQRASRLLTTAEANVRAVGMARALLVDELAPGHRQATWNS